MQIDFRLKDLNLISTKVDLCTVAGKYVVSAYTNALEGEANALVRIDNSEDTALGRTCLFSFRNGKQVCTSDLSYGQQLIIPQEDLDKIKYSLSLTIQVFNKSISPWSRAIERINAKHNEDNNNNFEKLPYDLAVPDFKYEEIIKESFFKKLINLFRKNQKDRKH